MNEPMLLNGREMRYLELLLAAGVLRFGEFKTKSGRISPYFFNTGCSDSGAILTSVAEIYAEFIIELFGPEIDNVFGPAYKGIPLAVAVAQSLARKLDHDVSFTFNRKEPKDHGEGGQLVGRHYHGGEKVVIVEDVITGGTSINETMPLLQTYKLDILGFVVGIDRNERGLKEESAISEVSQRWNIPADSVISVKKIVSFLHNRKYLGKVWVNDSIKNQIDRYLATYGGQ